MTNCANCNFDLNYHSETKTEICLKKLSKKLEGEGFRKLPSSCEYQLGVDTIV